VEPAPVAADQAPEAAISFNGRIGLNSATLEELTALPGVGTVTAKRILAYRETHGAFMSVADLLAVPGIGPARFKTLEELVEP
jgi:competence protein ComEA